jgi:hypothetical protein
MRTFLSREKKPICNWGSLNLNSYFEGIIPEGYKLCINPSPGYIVIDVDFDIKKDKNGYRNVPFYFTKELANTYHYVTPRGGMHYWFKYTGNKTLMNSTSKLDIDLRIGPKNGNNGGYVVYYLANNGDDIRNHLHEIKETSPKLNNWLELLFALDKE